MPMASCLGNLPRHMSGCAPSQVKRVETALSAVNNVVGRCFMSGDSLMRPRASIFLIRCRSNASQRRLTCSVGALAPGEIHYVSKCIETSFVECTPVASRRSAPGPVADIATTKPTGFRCC